jgi:hypothetical protein
VCSRGLYDPSNSYQQLLVDVLQVTALPLHILIPPQSRSHFKFYKLLRFVSWRAFNFWHVVSWITIGLLVTAFAFRVGDLAQHNNEANNLRLKSFQILSFVSPLIWYVLLSLVIVGSWPIFWVRMSWARLVLPCTDADQNIQNSLRSLMATSLFEMDLLVYGSWPTCTRYVGTMTICVARMLRESGIFFAVWFPLHHVVSLVDTHNSCSLSLA